MTSSIWFNCGLIAAMIGALVTGIGFIVSPKDQSNGVLGGGMILTGVSYLLGPIGLVFVFALIGTTIFRKDK